MLDNEINIAIEAAKASGKLLLENKNNLNKETSNNSKDVKLEADVSSENLKASMLSMFTLENIIQSIIASQLSTISQL